MQPPNCRQADGLLRRVTNCAGKYSNHQAKSFESDQTTQLREYHPPRINYSNVKLHWQVDEADQWRKNGPRNSWGEVEKEKFQSWRINWAGKKENWRKGKNYWYAELQSKITGKKFKARKRRFQWTSSRIVGFEEKVELGFQNFGWRWNSSRRDRLENKAFELQPLVNFLKNINIGKHSGFKDSKTWKLDFWIILM